MQQGEDFSPSYVQLAQQREVAKFSAFPTSSAVFPRVCPLTLPFQAPSIPCYHGEWNAGPIQVVGWIGFEVDGWWESYPSFSKHRPCLVLDISLARDWQPGREDWKGGWQCPAAMLFQFLGWNQQLWEGLKDFGAEPCPQAGWGMNAHLSACSCFPRAPRERKFKRGSCYCLWLWLEGWCDLCNLKGKVRKE